MEAVISLLVLSTLPHLVVPLVAFETSFRAVAELVSQDSRIFSGENARLKCSIPSNHRSSWRFWWFKGSEQLPQVGEHLVLWNTKVKDSGKFYCQGVRDTDVGDVLTLQSLPVEIIVYGGWAILQVPPHPSLVGHTLSVTCHVRRKPKLQEVVLYKNGFEVMRQIGPDPTFQLPDLTLQDEGMYSCRASWDVERRTLSVISAEAQVQVLEVLSQPFLEIVADNNLMTESKMKLVCHHQYNAPAPAPPIHYYFYEGDNQLGTATSDNRQLVKRTPGHYRCRAKVPELGLSQWSEFQTFGQVTGPKTMKPPILHPRDPWSLAPPNTSPDSSLPPVAEPTTAHLTPQLSTTSTFSQPPDVSTQPSNPQLNLSQSAPSTLSSVQPIQPMASTKPVNVVYEESGEMSGDMAEGSGDMAEGSWGMAEGSGDMAEGSWGMPEGSGDMPQGSGDMAEGSGDML
ncbi:high affinity immunoglobulin gamma Fc receptor I-like [Notolabrus celidotus]|uniref:high affinity immunoglobulin gamma Fc receptor I-like n=1 Tax=Notolabrus celidotus TaxID=1203425 RepID=UPI0014904718|nr:high affinity immunoglobulin gamma Fc receptor I-like [Notolabrus celidotus]